MCTETLFVLVQIPIWETLALELTDGLNSLGIPWNLVALYYLPVSSRFMIVDLFFRCLDEIGGIIFFHTLTQCVVLVVLFTDIKCHVMEFIQ